MTETPHEYGPCTECCGTGLASYLQGDGASTGFIDLDCPYCIGDGICPYCGDPDGLLINGGADPDGPEYRCRRPECLWHSDKLGRVHPDFDLSDIPEDFPGFDSMM